MPIVATGVRRNIGFGHCHNMKKSLLFFLFVLIPSFAFSDEPIVVVKHENPARRETTYVINSHGCIIGWELERFYDGRGFGIGEKSKCDLPLDQQTRFRGAILEKVIADTNNMQGMHNFVWGTLLRGDANDEYARRFTIAVSKQPQWDKKKGQLTGKAAKDISFFPNLINRENVFSELTALFSAHNLTLHAEDMEIVIVGNVDIPEAGITKQDKYPVDARLLFKITKKAGK